MYSKFSENALRVILLNTSKTFLQMHKYSEHHSLSMCTKNQQTNKASEYFYQFDDKTKNKIVLERIEEEVNFKRSDRFLYYHYCENGFLYHSYVGFLRRIDQNSRIFGENYKVVNYLFGADYNRIQTNNLNGYITHNSYLNLIYRYGLIPYVVLILLMYKIINRSSTDQKILFCFIVFMFFQNFDDYLFGNRVEVTFLFWFTFFFLLKKNYK